ncbi:MAG: arginine--tRNA ligase [Syntrophorhabdaceae bacterium]|nr:arginine--tRNA ligase [Syntrophorhabdaceae bacterium]
MIKKRIAELINEAIEESKRKGDLPSELEITPIIEIPREEGFGDYSTNVAFQLAPKLRKSPQEIATKLKDRLEAYGICSRIEIAGKGFINFYVREDIWRNALEDVCLKGVDSFLPDIGDNRKVLIEFVSSNPTGPLHIGHGRGAAVGDVLSNILKVTGHKVFKEYYVNDAGKQIETLGASTYARLLEMKGIETPFEAHFYQGSYVKDIAAVTIKQGIPVPTEKKEAIKFLARFASDLVLEGIKDDLMDFGVVFDNYFRESSLYTNGSVDDTLELLKDKGYTYEKDGALWFKTSLFENDEDRVLIKSDGEKTYFASDISYHRDKFLRSFDTLIDIWGSDHHGYIPRMKAAVQAIGGRKEDLKIVLIQFVTLIKDGKPVGMSTRSGQFTTLREVIQEVGKDVARFFFLMRKSDAHLEFDLDLAKKTTNENPVYYVQYAHARIESIFKHAETYGIDMDWIRAQGSNLDSLGTGEKIDLTPLTQKEELDLIKGILHFYDVLEGSAKSLEPHRLTFYLIDLVGKFHSYYNRTRILKNETNMTLARLTLLSILKKVIKKGLDILGVSAPEVM